MLVLVFTSNYNYILFLSMSSFFHTPVKNVMPVPLLTHTCAYAKNKEEGFSNIMKLGLFKPLNRLSELQCLLLRYIYICILTLAFCRHAFVHISFPSSSFFPISPNFSRDL